MTWTGYYDLVLACPKCKTENDLAEDLDLQVTCDDCSKEWEAKPEETFLEKQIQIECEDCGTFNLAIDRIQELEKGEAEFINVKCPDCEKSIKVTKKDLELESEDGEEMEESEDEETKEPQHKKVISNDTIGARRRGLIR